MRRATYRMVAAVAAWLLAVATAGVVTIASAGPASASVGSDPILYVASGGLTAYDAVTHTIVATTPIANGADHIVVNAAGTTAYVAGLGKAVTVVSTATNTVAATIPLGQYVDTLALSPNGAELYVPYTTGAAVAVISTVTNTVIATIPVGQDPGSVAFSPNGSLAYVTGFQNNTISVINTATRTVTATIPVGLPPNAIVFSPDGSTVYLAYGTDTYDVTEGFVERIDVATGRVNATVALSGDPSSIAMSPDGAAVYVTIFNDNSVNAQSPIPGTTVAVVDTASLTVTANITVGANPESIILTPDGSTAYVSNFASNTVSVINTAAKQVTATIGGFTYPQGLALITPGPTVTGLSPSSGPQTGGTTVTVTGSGLTGASAVLFGTAPATSFQVGSDSSITAVAPAAAAAGPVDVRVVTSAGTSAVTSTGTYTYAASPPTVTAVSPNTGPDTGGTTVTITGTGFTGASAVTLGGTPAVSFTVNSDSSITATAPPGTAGTVDVTVNNPGGTSATSAADRYTYTAAPAVTAVSPNQGPITGGTTLTITGSGFSGASAVTFGGTPAASFTVNSDTSITATALAASSVGSVDVTVTTSGGTSATGAADAYTYLGDTVTTLTTSASPSVSGQPVTLTATITALPPASGTPTGTVTFTIDGTAQTPLTLAAGSASFTAANLAAGTHTITADYSGDGIFTASTSAPLTQTVGQAASTVTLTSSANPLQTGQPGTVTAEVAPASPGAGTPTGTVTFTIDGTTQPPVTLADGTATLDLSTLPPGGHAICATYSGDANFTGNSSSPLTQTISQAAATITLASSANPAVTGQPMTITATTAPITPASGTPTGTVTFTIDGTTEQPLTLTSGSASLTLTDLPDGTHTITATYSGDTTFADTQSSTLTQTVGQAATATSLASSANPSSDGQAVALTATVTSSPPATGTPTGTVVFTIDGTAQTSGTALTNGAATLSVSSLAPGNHTITAAYQGSDTYTASTSPALTQTITQPAATTTTLTTSPSGSVTAGTAVTLTATENPPTAGSVQFYDGTTPLGSPIAVSAGQATYTTTALALAAHSLTATFTPSSPAYTPSTSAPVPLQVNAPGISIDQTITKSGTGTVTTAPFTTSGPRLLVAFTSSDGPATKQTTTVTGAGLTWTLAERANAKGGTAEIWTAYATGPLTNATVTSTPKTGGYSQQLTVEVFTGANGVGAGTVASKTGGTPTATVTTTKANSWVFGVGEDYTHATTITPAPDQTLLQQTQDTANGDTFWVQNQSSTTPTAGTKDTINDTAPNGDTWNLATIEIIPAS